MSLLGPFRGFVILASVVLLQQVEKEALKWREGVVVCLGRCRTEIWHEAVLLRVGHPVVGFLDVKVVDRLVL